MTNLFPSQIIVESLRDHAGIDISIPVAGKTENDTHCAACGVALPSGSQAARLKFGRSFTDWQYLVGETAHGGEVQVCRHCASLFSLPFLRLQATASAAIYSPKGAWIMTKDEERIAFLNSPPEPPFVAYIATTMGQHVAWRAPVTMDRDLLRIAVARDVITINRPLLFQAVKVCEGVMAKISQDILDEASVTGQEGGKGRGRPKTADVPKHPFEFLDRDMDAPSHGKIRDDYRRRMVSLGLHSEIRLLESLGEGELWGLSVLVKKKDEVPKTTTLKEKLADSASKKAKVAETA
jgi:CRISPR type IV-associated protein Csf1